MYKHIFLDFDDTIYDTHGNSQIALRELYAHFGLDRIFEDFDTYSQIYWKRNQEVWSLYSHGQMTRQELIVERFLYPLRQRNAGTAQEALQMNDWFLDCISQKTGLVDGAKDLLNYLQPNYHLHLLSNGFTEVQYKKLRSGGVQSYFEKVILSEAAGVNKPDPRIFDYALQQTGARREESLMIGDNFDTDIQGAINSHIDQIFYNVHPAFVAPLAPTYEVRSLKEIKLIL